MMFQNVVMWTILLLNAIGSLGSDNCDRNPEWCDVPMPKKSYFGFEPPTDVKRWKLAQNQASNGEHTLLKESIKHFHTPMDFVDGDIQFKYAHSYTDMFLDREQGFYPLTDGSIPVRATKKYWRHASYTPTSRIPIVMAGFGLWGLTHKDEKGEKVSHFLPNTWGGAGLGAEGFSIDQLLQDWSKFRRKINRKYILIVMLNENWGLLSCAFPGRTAGWGKCKDRPVLQQFLDDPNLVMLMVNQHHNTSHPKVLSWPRGIPLQWKNTNQFMWDTMLKFSRDPAKDPEVLPRDKLIFSGGSGWGPRPRIIECVSERVREKDWLVISGLERIDYYRAMTTTKFGLALPGLGYDCFRLWELMLLGTIPIMERGVGYDRTLWRLPALLLDDFADVSTELLQQAYVEALYRAKEFEYFRLKQSYWAELLFNVSATGSLESMLSRHPMSAEDAGFTRPRVRYDCGVAGELCGKGTKRIPKRSCVSDVDGGYFTGKKKKMKLMEQEEAALQRVRQQDEEAVGP